MHPKRARLKQIAEALNLSTGTVSRALSGRGEIAEKTRVQVTEMAARMNYTGRRSKARNDKSFRRIAVCVGNPCTRDGGALDPSFVGFHYVLALERAASAENIGLMVKFVDAETEAAQLAQMPLFHPDEIQGAILVYPYPEAVVQSLARRVRVLSIEHIYPSVQVDTIGPAHATDAMLAVEHLHRMGHRRIAFVSDEEARGHRLTTGLRHAGFVSGLTRCNLPYCDGDVINVLPPYIAKPNLAAWVKARHADGVTAVVTSIDRHGYLLWENLPAMGIHVPQAISLVGIGGIYRTAGQPQLTTWRCNYDTIAKVAINTLRARHEGAGGIELYQEIASVFVPGGSSGPAKA